MATFSKSIPNDFGSTENQQRNCPKFPLNEKEIAWNKSCEEAAQHYHQTKLHVTHEEVVAWIESLGTDDELPAPTCHT